MDPDLQAILDRLLGKAAAGASVVDDAGFDVQLEAERCVTEANRYLPSGWQFDLGALKPARASVAFDDVCFELLGRYSRG